MFTARRSFPFSGTMWLRRRQAHRLRVLVLLRVQVHRLLYQWCRPLAPRREARVLLREIECTPRASLRLRDLSGHLMMEVETHPDPEHALSDGPQSLYFNQFEDLMRQISLIANAIGRSVGQTKAI